MHLDSPVAGLCRWWQACLAPLCGLQLLINQGFKLRPRQGTFDDVAVVFIVTAAGPDDEGRRGNDVVQFGF